MPCPTWAWIESIYTYLVLYVSYILQKFIYTSLKALCNWTTWILMPQQCILFVWVCTLLLYYFREEKVTSPLLKKVIFSFQQWGIKHIGYSETPIKWTPNRTDDSNPWSSSTRSKRNNSSDNETNSVELSNPWWIFFLLLKNWIYT